MRQGSEGCSGPWTGCPGGACTLTASPWLLERGQCQFRGQWGKEAAAAETGDRGKIECAGLGAEFDMGGPISWEQPGTNSTEVEGGQDAPGSRWWVIWSPTETETGVGGNEKEEET